MYYVPTVASSRMSRIGAPRAKEQHTRLIWRKLSPAISTEVDIVGLAVPRLLIRSAGAPFPYDRLGSLIATVTIMLMGY